jgi:predicted amidophosphoribosyltransferase
VVSPTREAIPPPVGVLGALERAFLGVSSLALGGPAPWEAEPIDAACARCGRSVGPGEFSLEDGRCPGCRPEKLRWERLVRLGPFDGQLRSAILETKYAGWRRQGTLLGRLLGARLRLALATSEIEPERALIVPVPMPWSRRMRRGIDHALTIARGAGDASGCRVARLLRRREGPTQTSVTPSRRASNLRDRIRLARSIPHESEVVIILDDVRTTGATLDACCRVIGSREGVRLWGAVCATAPERVRREAAEGGARMASARENA